MFYEKRHTFKTCVNFIPSRDSDHTCHGCGYPWDDHFDYKNHRTWTRSKSWRQDLHIEALLHTSQSINRKMKFQNQVENIEKIADFSILADDTHPALVLRKLCKDWNLDLPNIVISVTGDAAINVPARHLPKFKQGLLKAVCSTTSWVLTGGTNQGVDAVVTDALREAQLLSWMGSDAPNFHILGMVNWNRISQHNQINHWIFQTPDKPYVYNVQTKTQDEVSGEIFPALNPLCSHYICIENGMMGKKATEVMVRSGVEELLSSDPTNKDSPFHGIALSIPTVVVLFGGDFDVFERAANALSKGIPIVLCEGCGNASDILVSAIKLASKNPKFQLTHEQEQLIVSTMENVLSKPRTKGTLFPDSMFEGACHLSYVRECIKFRRLIFFYRIKRSDSKLDIAILRALLVGNAARRQDPVELAVHWNRCDEVVKELLAKEQDINLRENISRVVTTALLGNKPDFVKLFHDFNFNFTRYLTPNRLATLYERATASNPAIASTLKPFKKRLFQ